MITASQVLLLSDVGRVSSSSDKQNRTARLTHLTASLSTPNFESSGHGEKKFSADQSPQPHDQVSAYEYLQHLVFGFGRQTISALN